VLSAFTSDCLCQCCEFAAGKGKCSRAQEFAVRSALGASRARLLRQLLTESLTLSVLGGALGLAVAAVGTHFIVKILPQNLPRATGIHLDWLVLCFTDDSQHRQAIER
jgi:predicted lysophospholipase L1 biosynthesis ABC-type transport system permease subunit